MNLFHRKTPLERALEGLAAVSTSGPALRAAKITAGVLGGAVTLTGLSAAVSSARRGTRQ